MGLRLRYALIAPAPPQGARGTHGDHRQGKQGNPCPWAPYLEHWSRQQQAEGCSNASEDHPQAIDFANVTPWKLALDGEQ